MLLPVTGASQSLIQLEKVSAPPAIDNAASTISGIVMILGDSCGWTPSRQRLSPKKVRIITRVM